MAKQSMTEEESTLKRQARRRLIGAVALVLAVVIVLPLVFDKDPSPTMSNDIELRIPDKDNVPPLPHPVSAVEVAAPVAQVSAPVSQVAAAVPAPVVTQEEPPAVEPPKPQVTQSAKTPAKPKAETQPAAKAAPKSGWGVQVGAYSNVDTAKHLQAKLIKEGFHAYTEKAGGVMRVRVGSYSSREAAEKTKRKLEGIGLHPNVVNLEQSR